MQVAKWGLMLAARYWLHVYDAMIVASALAERLRRSEQ
jgi:predicted nucleic acid-binding protein